MLLLRGSKSNKSSDYPSEFKWYVFIHWCTTKVIPATAATGVSSVVVLDRTRYYTVLDEQDERPATSCNKSRLVDTVKRWGGAPEDWPLIWDTGKTRIQLLEHAGSVYPTSKCKIEKIAGQFETATFSIKILILPVAYPELNPIEMVWSFFKRAVASKNIQFQLGIF